jgi:hypothetical protein
MSFGKQYRGDVSEENVALIFTADKEANQETSLKQVAVD